MSGRRDPARYREQTQGQEQRLDVMARDGWACRFERAVPGLPAGSTHHEGQRIVEWAGDVAWMRCGAENGLQTCHLPRRWKCGNTLTDDGIPLKHHPLVAIAGCAECHRRYDSRLYRGEVRAPADAIAIAKRLIAHTIAAARARGEYVVDVDLSGL